MKNITSLHAYAEAGNSITFNTSQSLAEAIAFGLEHNQASFFGMFSKSDDFDTVAEDFVIEDDKILIGYVVRNEEEHEIVKFFRYADGAYDAALTLAIEEDERTEQTNEIGMVWISRETFEEFAPA